MDDFQSSLHSFKENLQALASLTFPFSTECFDTDSKDFMRKQRGWNINQERQSAPLAS